MLCSTLPVYAFNNTEFNMSEIESYNVLSGKMEKNILTLKIDNVSGDNYCLVVIDGVQEICEVKDEIFNLTFDLDNISKGKHLVEIYSGNENDETFWSFLSRSFEIDYINSEWVIVENVNYKNNLEISKNKSEFAFKIIPVTSKVKKFSDEIVIDCQSDLEKVSKIYEWITTNIAYDMKSFNLKINSYYAPDDVLDTGKAVCYGVALTFRALCHAQGIPCTVELGTLMDEEGNFVSHSWNEVYIDGKWGFVDCTSDLGYIYNDNDELEKTNNGDVNFEYFLCDLNGISNKYTYQGIDDKFQILLSPSVQYNAWVKDEFINSVYYLLIEDEVAGHLGRPITRGEFCELLVRYLLIQMYDKSIFNMSETEILDMMNKDLNSIQIPFISEKDIITPEIAICYKYGIVNGKTSDYFGVNDNITRQEASAMLVRAMKLLNETNSNYKMSDKTDIRFADDDLVGDWAKSYVSIVNDMGVMNGVGNNKFNPRGQYTVEQTIATLIRLYRFNYER